MLRATSELLHEVGLRAMTTEEIASRSGASKATIYKWWPNKYAVAIDAFLSEMMAESADPDTGSARDDSAAVRARAPALLHRAERTRLRATRRRGAEPTRWSSRNSARISWTRAANCSGRSGTAASTRGEMRDDVDPEAAIDLVIGPALYRLMIGHAPLTEAAADALMDVAVRGLANSD